MRLKSGTGPVAVGVAVFALSAWAHHSHGAYNETFMDIEGVVKEVQPGGPAFLDLSGSQGREWRAGSLGSGSDRAHRAPKSRNHTRLRQSGRHRQSAVPPSQGWLQRLSSGIPEGQGWNRQRLGRQQRAGPG